jgi:peptidoglycan/LPS O-acetylase OafA/YrhL
VAITAQAHTPVTAPVKTGNTYPALDGLRALAALCVVMTHVGFQTGQSFRGTFGAFLNRLDFGVTIFFLLSGFLLYGPFVRAQLLGRPLPSVRTYLRNRGLRIVPGAWVAIAVAFVFSASKFAGVHEIVRQLLFAEIYSSGHLLPGMTQMWSLCVEVAFYLALPLLAVLARVGSRPLRAQAWLLGLMFVSAQAWWLLTRGLADAHPATANLWLPAYLDWFALGMGVAVLRSWHDLTGRGRVLDQIGDASLTCWAIAGLLFWVTATPLGGPRGLADPTPGQAITKHLLYAFAALFLLLPAVFGTDQRSPVRRVLESRPSRWLGKISYGVFLWHIMLLDLAFNLAGKQLFTGHVLLITALVVPMSLAVAALSLRLVEQPALDLKRRWATSGR